MMTKVLRVGRLRYLLRAIHRMAVEARAGGKPIFTQIQDVRLLRALGAGVGIDDYFDLRLFERSVTREALRTYIGEGRINEFARLFNDPRYWIFAWDKLLFDAWASSYDLPVPRVKAVVGGVTIPTKEPFQKVRSLPEFRALLSHNDMLPAFLKPVSGRFGASSFFLKGFDENEDRVYLSGEAAMNLEEFWEQLWIKHESMDRRRGYLMQEPVVQHLQVTEAVGPRLSTVRLVSLLTAGGVDIIAGEWKISTGDHASDNFDGGRSGNLLAGIDLQSGRTTRVSPWYGSPPQTSFPHPDTNVELVGLGFPEWERALDLVKYATTGLPMLRMQHWDVGFSQTGPMLIEVNSVGGPHMLQYINSEGFLTEGVRNAAMEEAEKIGEHAKLPAWMKPQSAKEAT